MKNVEYQDPRYPRCDCFADLDMQLRTKNGNPLLTYSVCRECGKRAQSPCPRHHVLTLQKWRELLTEIGEEVVLL